jgi:hypothetical protein
LIPPRRGSVRGGGVIGRAPPSVNTVDERSVAIDPAEVKDYICDVMHYIV